MSKKHYIIPIFVPHEGCPHDCVFCNQNSITGINTKITSNMVKDVIEKYLQTIPETNRILEVSFFGGTFTAINIEKQKELLKVAKYYKDLGIVNFIRLSTRPDYIDDVILSNLKDFSVDIIELGVQSLDNEVLTKSARGHTRFDVINASNLIKKYGFILGHQIMLGLPGDTFEKDIETARSVASLQPNICRIYPALVIKDTPMERMYKTGLYKPYSLDETIKITKIVYSILNAHGIKVIRMGLQTTEEISENGDIVAGPFHPAFREIVEGSILNDLIVENIPENYHGEVKIEINSKDVSKLFCDKKRFFNDTKEQLKTSSIKIMQSFLIDRGEIVIKYDDVCNKLSINDYLIRKYKEGYFSIL
ncbi:radical SAM protein [Clostridium sp. SYSU_GA19001]|uniref:elongator complex protein 3 n=1 Tax=Clostridium caldaquaticum TaxID=2940653 RepID=UPI00207734B6|nr:radical SAM protein [Clostridium caldaquaticum]MCM8710595.1 radical SAM protein [Clostridium caldaquaticum]